MARLFPPNSGCIDDIFNRMNHKKYLIDRRIKDRITSLVCLMSVQAGTQSHRVLGVEIYLKNIKYISSVDFTVASHLDILTCFHKLMKYLCLIDV